MIEVCRKSANHLQIILVFNNYLSHRIIDIYPRILKFNIIILKPVNNWANETDIYFMILFN